MASLQEELEKRQKNKHPDEVTQDLRDQKKRDKEQLNTIRQKHIDSEKNAIKTEKELGLRKTNWKSRRQYKQEGRSDRDRINKAREYGDREFDTLQANKKVEADRQKAIDEENWANYNKWEGLAQQDDLQISDFQEKENLFKQFAGQENFIKEKIFALSDIIENNATDDVTKTSLIRVMEEIAASHNQFKESQQDTYALIEKDKAGTLRGEDLFTNQSDIDEFNLSRGITTAPSTNVQGQTDIQAAQSDVKTKDTPKWSGEVGSRTLNKISPIQQKLLDSGHSQEGLVQLMEKNQEFQANRPKVTDLLKIFKK